MTNLQARTVTLRRRRLHIKHPHLSNYEAPYFNPLEFISDDLDLVGAFTQAVTIARNADRSGVSWDDSCNFPHINILAGAFLLTKWVARVEADPGLANALMVGQILNLPNLTTRLIGNRNRLPTWIYNEFLAVTTSQTDNKSAILLTCIKMLAPIVITQLKLVTLSIEYSKKVVKYNEILDRLLPSKY
ncbi:hypothetical protein [Chamaesiphon sp.]|uniref:hypothetical protein n=1 Tax=Chamaesiphon sp. TaxID=2814140 RepID=UPI003593DF87